MKLAAAKKRIETAVETLGRAIGEPVFDEWALVGKGAAGWKLLEYGGARRAQFQAGFKSDMAALRETFDPESAQLGDFAFSHEGYGSGFDAHMCVGDQVFVLFNNTVKSTGEITKNPKWTAAQIHFTNLLEAFIADPVTP